MAAHRIASRADSAASAVNPASHSSIDSGPRTMAWTPRSGESLPDLRVEIPQRVGPRGEWYSLEDLDNRDKEFASHSLLTLTRLRPFAEP